MRSEERPPFNGDVKLWRVAFDDGERKLDLWASAPLLGAGEQACMIDGRPETVLSTAQILRGKLERSDEHLARDVFDIAKASEKDPEALEAAINAISRPLAESIAQNFHWAAPAIAVEAEGTLGGVPADEGIPPRQLGNRGAHAISNALYTMCSIRTRDGAIEVATATRAQGEKTRRIEATSAEHDFEAAGLNAYLRAKGPGPRALLDYARESCARCQDALVFEADADGVRGVADREGGHERGNGGPETVTVRVRIETGVPTRQRAGGRHPASSSRTMWRGGKPVRRRNARGRECSPSTRAYSSPVTGTAL